MISSFEFVNPSERDTFHGESVYKNTLPLTNKYSNYALSSTACTNVLGLLGGIGLTTDSNHSEGLVGSETVAIGITADKMEKYGLYANTIYFELPRSLVTIKHDDPDKLDDISYFATLGFTLFISDYDYEENCRYIASDMYDVIVKVEGNDFEYLDLSFIDFWATRNVVLVNYKNIDKLTADFYLEDFSGSCEFDVTATTVYVANGETYLTRPADVTSTKKDILKIDVSASGNLSSGSTPSKLIQYLAATGKDSVTIADFYNAVASAELGYQVDLSNDETSLGASCFQDMLLLMFNTYYLGTLDADEQAAGKECKKLMTLTFEVEGSERDTYTYDFYRIDDRRVMVSLYNPGYSNEVTDFYITTFAFKKIVYGFECLFNGQEIDLEAVYG